MEKSEKKAKVPNFLIISPSHYCAHPPPHHQTTTRLFLPILTSTPHTHNVASPPHPLAAGHHERRWPPRRRWPYVLLLHRDIHHVAARSEKTAPCTENAEPPSNTAIGGRFRPPRPPPTQVCS